MISNYWDRVKKVKADLNFAPEVYITSLDRPDRFIRPGVTNVALLEIAAKSITEGTFRVATAEEVAAYDLDFERRTEATKAETRMKNLEDRKMTSSTRISRGQ